MPLIDFLSSLPLWLLALGLNAFLVGIALGGVWLVRRQVLPALRFQALLMAGVASFIAMVLFVIVALDRPFSGDMGISADSCQLVIDHHMKS